MSEYSSAAKRQRIMSDSGDEGSGAAARCGMSASPALRRPDTEVLLSRPSPFGNETGELANGEFDPTSAKEAVASARVLCIGAGGLGCEVLHDLALSGFKNIDIIDADTVDLTNLNRQFLFRKSDIGKPKALAAAEFVMRRCPGVTVTPHVCYIQDKDEAFYRQFRVVIGGLDNLVARRWINALLCSFVEVDEEGGIMDPEQIIPYVDGGTEGFKGQVRLVIPRITACFECSIDTFPPPTSFQLCTIAETPRKPEHCVAYAMVKLWEEAFPGRKIDKDSTDDMRWLCDQAQARAAAYGIEGVTYSLTMGVVKSIIPAIASTNALIAAASVLEALKLVSFAAQTMNNYFMYMGQEGLYSATQALERKADCAACGRGTITMTVPGSDTLEALIARLKEDPERQLSNPSLGIPGKQLYFAAPPALRAATSANLPLRLCDLMADGQEVIVTDPVMPHALSIVLRFADCGGVSSAAAGAGGS